MICVELRTGHKTCTSHCHEATPTPALPPEGGGSRKALHRSPPPNLLQKRGEGLGVGCWRACQPEITPL
jgi:hypothetical protein